MTKIQFKTLRFYKWMVIITAPIYIMTHLILGLITNWTYLQTTTELFLVYIYLYPCLLIVLFEYINNILNIKSSMIITGGLFESVEPWFELVSAIPVIGIIPISIRIVQKISKITL
jgi:hypothetical protein